MTAESRIKTQPAVSSKTNTLRFLIGVALSALSGLLLLLSFPPYGAWYLVWFALVPVIIAQNRLFSTKWSSLAVSIQAAVWLGPFLARVFGPEFGPFFQYLGLLIAVLNLFISTERKFHEKTGFRWLVPQGVAGWVGFEMVRVSFIPIIASTAFIGYTQSTQPWLIQPVSIFSIFGLNIVIVLVNYALGQGAMAVFDQKWQFEGIVPVDRKITRAWLYAAGGVLTGWIIISLVILNTQPGNMPKVRVAALRPNFPLPAHQDPINTSQIRFDTFTQQAREAAKQGAQILYTPEMMFNFDPQVEYTAAFRALAKETGATIFITYTVGIEGQPWRNEAVMLTPDGKFSQVYGKFHTWAIGEPPTPSAGVFPAFDTPLGKLATLICHDANYTDVARKLSRQGAQLIAAPYREFGGFGEQAWNNALFRAVENRVAVVLTGVATVSAIINPDGSLVALDTNINGSRGILIGDVTLGAGGAPYTVLGDILGWVSLAGFILFMIFQSIVNRRKSRSGS